MTLIETRVAEVLAGPSGPRIAALFDFDGTVVDGLSITSFVRRPGVPLGAIVSALARAGPSAIARLATNALSREPSDAAIRAAYELAFRLWMGRPVADLQAHAVEVYAKDLAVRLREGVRTLVEAHLEMAHTVAIVTSATRFQAGPAAIALGIRHLLCTELAVGAGLIRGGLEGPLLRGTAKAEAARAFAADHRIDLMMSHAYADTADDVPFLESVGNPAAVCPAPGLARTCGERGWPVLRASDPGPVKAGAPC